MTDNQKKIIRDMRQQGMSYSTIAAAHGLSANTVKSFCRRENIDIQSVPNGEKKNLCKNCGAPLNHHPGAKKKTFCSDKCRYTWWNKHRIYLGHKNIHRLTCFHCGSEFYSNNKKRKYCGRECYIHSHFGEELP
jgi:protein-arginine kinase activator protein McsA